MTPAAAMTAPAVARGAPAGEPVVVMVTGLVTLKVELPDTVGTTVCEVMVEVATEDWVWEPEAEPEVVLTTPPKQLLVAWLAAVMSC